ncbi:MAG: diadenylate cyclase [Trueperaceae bacterium]|nr:diadenylate cyclase [Trueperaceae bacterium]
MFRDVELFDEAYLAKRSCRPEALVQVTLIALELAREGREGRKIGALFTVDDHAAVLARSRPLILDPLEGHPDEAKTIVDPNVRETLKELAQLDGAFVVSGEGIAVAACRYLSASAEGIELPLGLGSRHMAAASISAQTRTVSVVVSESSMVRIFDRGELVTEIVPELWMLRQFGTQVRGKVSQRAVDPLAVVTKEE